jgi:hypothetical protein
VKGLAGESPPGRGCGTERRAATGGPAAGGFPDQVAIHGRPDGRPGMCSFYVLILILPLY